MRKSTRTTRIYSGPQRTGDLLGGGAGFTPEMQEKLRQHSAPLVWAEVVGEYVAAATEVLGVENGVLRISARTSAWANEISLRKPDLLRRLNDKINQRGVNRVKTAALRDIHCVARGISDKKTAKPSLNPRRTPPADELNAVKLPTEEIVAIEKCVHLITDATLRSRLRNARMAEARLRYWRMENGWQPCGTCGTLAPPPLSVACSRCRVESGL